MARSTVSIAPERRLEPACGLFLPTPSRASTIRLLSLVTLRSDPNVALSIAVYDSGWHGVCLRSRVARGYQGGRAFVEWIGRGVAPVCVVVLLVTLAFAAGCGDDSGDPEVTLRITLDFGRELLAGEQLSLEGHDTALKLLRENHRVAVGEYGFVESIDGLRQKVASRKDDRETTWVVNLNGIETDAEANELRLVDGDVVQFDLRDWYVTRDVRATVGAFPQPLAGGVLGVRPPVSVRCTPGYESACREVRGALREAGVDPYGRRPEQPAPTRGLRRARETQSVVSRAVVLVGPWRNWRDRPVPERIDHGTRYSGVFARFSPDAASLRLLDWDENLVKTSGPGTGLVAAIRPSREDLFWLVTGVDRDGVDRAARAFDADSLRDAFAVAVTDAGIEKLPLPKPTEAGEPLQPADGVEFPGRLVVRGVRAGQPDADGPVYVLSPDGRRRVGGLRCRRLHVSPAGPGLCLRVSSNGFDYEAVVLNDDLRPLDSRRVEGVPSRVRVSPDGRYGSFTAFTTAGGGYFADTGEFSTSTRILDMRSGETLLALEDLDVRRGDRRLEPEGAELWGVVFDDDGRFYATLAPADDVEHLLIEGRVGSRRGRVVAEDVECPALSPDGTRVAYKRRIGETNRWRLHVRHLESGRDVALAETRSIDDQPEWLGDDLVAYSDGKAVYAVPAAGGGSPKRLADRATSPAWLPIGMRGVAAARGATPR